MLWWKWMAINTVWSNTIPHTQTKNTRTLSQHLSLYFTMETAFFLISHHFWSFTVTFRIQFFSLLKSSQLFQGCSFVLLGRHPDLIHRWLVLKWSRAVTTLQADIICFSIVSPNAYPWKEECTFYWILIMFSHMYIIYLFLIYNITCWFIKRRW